MSFASDKQENDIDDDKIGFTLEVKINNRDSADFSCDGKTVETFYYDCEKCEYFHVKAVITYEDGDEGETLAECNGIFISDDNVDKDNTFTCIADDVDGDAYIAFEAMENSKKYVPKEKENEDDFCELIWYEETGCIYLARLYVNPKFRNRGIAKIILRNIAKLFVWKYDIAIRYACIIVKQDEQHIMPEKQMEKLMIKTITDNGFTRVRSYDGEKIYIKKYSCKERTINGYEREELMQSESGKQSL